MMVSQKTYAYDLLREHPCLSAPGPDTATSSNRLGAGEESGT